MREVRGEESSGVDLKDHKSSGERFVLFLPLSQGARAQKSSQSLLLGLGWIDRERVRCEWHHDPKPNEPGMRMLIIHKLLLSSALKKNNRFSFFPSIEVPPCPLLVSSVPIVRESNVYLDIDLQCGQ